MARRYSGNEFASVANVAQCSSSARTAIADSVTAALLVVNEPASTNDGAPTPATNGALKDDSIIAIGSAITVAAAGKRHWA